MEMGNYSLSVDEWLMSVVSFKTSGYIYLDGWVPRWYGTWKKLSPIGHGYMGINKGLIMCVHLNVDA